MSDDNTIFHGQLMQAAERIGFNSSNFHVFIFEGEPDKPSIDRVTAHFRGGSITGLRSEVASLVNSAKSPDDLLTICRERGLFRDDSRAGLKALATE